MQTLDRIYAAIKPFAETLRIVHLRFHAAFTKPGPLESWGEKRPYLLSLPLHDGWGKYFGKEYRKPFERRPYLIAAPVLGNARVLAGQQFSFDCLLFGQGCWDWARSVRAFSRLAEEGIGKRIGDRDYRRPFFIYSLHQVMASESLPLWQSEEPDDLKPPNLDVTLASYVDLESLMERSRDLKSLTVIYTTPTVFNVRIWHSDRTSTTVLRYPHQDQISAAHICQYAFNRLKQSATSIGCVTQSFRSVEKIHFDYDDMNQPTKVSHKTECRYYHERYSRQERNKDRVRGWIGLVRYWGDVEAMYFLLGACRPLGIGQRSAMGFGRYKVISDIMP